MYSAEQHASTLIAISTSFVRVHDPVAGLLTNSVVRCFPQSRKANCDCERN